MKAESQHLEYKRELSDGLGREVVAFLNHRDGGRILIGVDDAGVVVGLSNPDGDQLNLEDKELMRIFRDLEMVEYLGSGIPRILKAYSKEAFRFTENFTRMRFASAEPSVGEPSERGKVESKVETPSQILRLLEENPKFTLRQLAVEIEKSISLVEKTTAKLVKEGKLRHVGSKKSGTWEV
jgi:predicted HTH transcriptional regulator